MHADDIRIVLLQLKLFYSVSNYHAYELSNEWKSIMCVGIFFSPETVIYTLKRLSFRETHVN